MPENQKNFAYGGTITFMSHLDFPQKRRIILSLKDLFEKALWGVTSDLFLTTIVEYHKVSGVEDHEAPHIHFILYSSKRLFKYQFNSVVNLFNKSIGRTQFYLMTSIKTSQYLNYILKDIDINCPLDNQQGYRHYLEYYLYPDMPQNDFGEIFTEDFD